MKNLHLLVTNLHLLVNNLHFVVAVEAFSGNGTGALRQLVEGGRLFDSSIGDLAADVLATLHEVHTAKHQPPAEIHAPQQQGLLAGEALHDTTVQNRGGVQTSFQSVVPNGGAAMAWPSTAALHTTASTLISLGAQGVLTQPHVDALCDGLGELAGTEESLSFHFHSRTVTPPLSFMFVGSNWAVFLTYFLGCLDLWAHSWWETTEQRIQ